LEKTEINKTSNKARISIVEVRQEVLQSYSKNKNCNYKIKKKTGLYNYQGGQK